MAQIKFSVDQRVNKIILSALEKYGDYEIGGILVARQIASNHFEIIDASVSDESNSQSVTHFVRGTRKSQQLLKKHFAKKTGHYAGEWHSHPNFSLAPSPGDAITMLNILNDPAYGVSFAVLMIARLINYELRYKMYFFHRDLNHIIRLD